MSKKIHIIMLGCGEYSEREEYVYKAFYSQDKAVELVDELSAKLSSISLDDPDSHEKYDQILGVNSIYSYSYSKPVLYLEEVEIEDGDAVLVRNIDEVKND